MEEAMSLREFLAIVVACITLTGIVSIVASCDQQNTREQTRQVEILHTNVVHPNPILHP
jgi:hypothetical protein